MRVRRQRDCCWTVKIISWGAEAPHPDAASKDDEHRVLDPCGAILGFPIGAVNVHCDLPMLPQPAPSSLAFMSPVLRSARTETFRQEEPCSFLFR